MSDQPQPTRIIDPGSGGWAEEPKVTQPELLLYGNLAGAVRLLGQAAVAAGDAYSLICKHGAGTIPDELEAVVADAVPKSYELYDRARAVHREVAGAASGFIQAVYTQAGKPDPEGNEKIRTASP